MLHRRRFCSVVAGGVASLSVGCGRIFTGEDSRSPDDNGDSEGSKTVEVYIEAGETTKEYVPGHKTKVWAYNGQVPGKTIHANVGDTLVVHYVNYLPEPTTLHWHGLELPAGMDGSHISQDLVPPNGGKFTYEFKLLRAATYWFHSHVKPNEQVEKGLQGMLVVHDPDENKRLGLPQNEMEFMLDDVLLDDEHQIAPPLPQDPIERAIEQANGREADLIVVNGERLPQYEVTAGEPIRMRFVNSANARLFRLDAKGQSWVRIGGDTGLLPQPVAVDPVEMVEHEDEDGTVISKPDRKQGLRLAPGERAEMVLTPKGEIGDVIELVQHDFPRGRHVAKPSPKGDGIELFPDPQDGTGSPKTIATFKITQKANRAKPYSVPKKLRPMERLSLEEAKKNPKLKVLFGHTNADENGEMTFFAQADMKDGMMKPVPVSEMTNEKALNAKVGETRLLEIVNFTPGIHPFHMHGFPFQVVEIEYQDDEYPERNRVVRPESSDWLNREFKDTIQVPGRTGFRMKSRTILRALVRFDDKGRAGQVAAHGGQFKDGRSGGWYTHCHILEHSAHGMATWVNLSE